jgi:hypothetical protein
MFYITFNINPMRAITLLLFLLACLVLQGQNTDLPTPTPNIQVLPAGSYVIAMDNTNQANNSGDFNVKAYGLIVHLLNNSVKVKWVITAGKVKDGTDISVNAQKIKPVSGVAAAFSFKAGPFVIFANDTSGVAGKIDAFNSDISNANDKIKVYKTTASTSVDIRYDLTGFIPKAAILDDGASVNIHISYMTSCNITSANYRTAVGTDLLTDCYTFASEAHNGNTGNEIDNAIAAIHRFVEFGGNFLAQCEAVSNYENNVLGRFQSSNGLTIENTNPGTNVSYGNPDLSYSQYEGAFNMSKGGSVKNWSVNGSTVNNFHKHASGSITPLIIGASVSKLRSGSGGLVFFLGNHRYDDQLGTLGSINGLRMYMNAFLTPVGIATNCNIGEIYMYPLSYKVLKFSANTKNDIVKLSWDIYENETMNYFDVESSSDGIHFARLATVSANQLPGIQSYNFTNALDKGIFYFRIKLIAEDKTQQYSKVIAVQNAPSANDLKILNNPVIDDRLELSYASDYNSERATLKIIDINGQVKFIQLLNIQTGINKIDVLLPSALTNGLYVAELTTSSKRTILKFIK